MTLRPKRRKRMHLEAYNIERSDRGSSKAFKVRKEMTMGSFNRYHEDAGIIAEINADVSIGEIVDHAAFQYKHAVIVDFDDDQWKQYEQLKFIQRLST